MTSACSLSLARAAEERLASGAGREMALRLALTDRDAEIATLRARVDVLTAALEEHLARGIRDCAEIERQIAAMTEAGDA